MAETNPNSIWESEGWEHDVYYLDEVINDFLDEFEFSPYERGER